MTTIVINYTVNPLWAGLKRFGKAFIASREASGRIRAAHYLASMGYYEEAKSVMLDHSKKES